jgi:hypothetical protein
MLSADTGSTCMQLQMFSYTIKCVTYAKKGSQAGEKKTLTEITRITNGNVPEENKCNNLSLFVLV